MHAEKPESLPSAVGRTLGRVPADVRLIVQRFQDHALDPRSSPSETVELVRALGYRDVAAFCAAAGLPAHLAERWVRFGISTEMRQVLMLMASHRRAVADAVEEFEAATHAGLDDFMAERGLI
ncbi:MAG: hypothetical protein J0H53_17665 [Rhizobiales bacterium]|jgi:hypothetical protein|nr:hypothetical protein [Hyphomicrobiales bacterium]OJU36259.1 MAG: hypothetical protein BGN94_12140 [Rhizobiales bacterium 68-8]